MEGRKVVLIIATLFSEFANCFSEQNTITQKADSEINGNSFSRAEMKDLVHQFVNEIVEEKLEHIIEKRVTEVLDKRLSEVLSNFVTGSVKPIQTYEPADQELNVQNDEREGSKGVGLSQSVIVDTVNNFIDKEFEKEFSKVVQPMYKILASQDEALTEIQRNVSDLRDQLKTTNNLQDVCIFFYAAL